MFIAFEPPMFEAVAAFPEASNDDIMVICAGMLTVGVGAWSFLGNSQSTRSAKTQVERILADGPALKLVTEKSSYVPLTGVSRASRDRPKPTNASTSRTAAPSSGAFHMS